MAGMSFLRIMVGSAFPCSPSRQVYCLPRANIVADVSPRSYSNGSRHDGDCSCSVHCDPTGADTVHRFLPWPWIRARSPYSKLLMEEERKRIEIEGSGSGERAVELEVEKDLEAAAVAKYGGGSRPGAEPHTTARPRGGHARLVKPLRGNDCDESRTMSRGSPDYMNLFMDNVCMYAFNV